MIFGPWCFVSAMSQWPTVMVLSKGEWRDKGQNPPVMFLLLGLGTCACHIWACCDSFTPTFWVYYWVTGCCENVCFLLILEHCYWGSKEAGMLVKAKRSRLCHWIPRSCGTIWEEGNVGSLEGKGRQHCGSLQSWTWM